MRDHLTTPNAADATDISSTVFILKNTVTRSSFREALLWFADDVVFMVI